MGFVWLKIIKFHCQSYYLSNMTRFQKNLLLHQGMKDLMHSLVLWDKMMITKAQTFSMWQSSYTQWSYSLKYWKVIIAINTHRSIKYYLCCFEKDWYKVIYTYLSSEEQALTLHKLKVYVPLWSLGEVNFLVGSQTMAMAHAKIVSLKRGLLTTCDLGQ